MRQYWKGNIYPERDREEEKAGIFLTRRVVVKDRVVTPPAPNLEFDQLAMSENEKTDKPFLLQSLQSGQGLAAEACAEILGQFLHGHDPFAGVDGVANAINALV